MTILDDAQSWIVEIIGTIIFLLSAGNFILPMVGQQAHVDVAISVFGIIVGLILMGKKALAKALKLVLK